ncbi:unnamed protein product [Darwinula stevensoni]|uniref:Pre-rRNA-processing protein Ipi1 N-terminal domain-containing protein n=1 Tax=Darwinula stevensoni TaxID=69355 RepID=A0A7R9AFZ6_9CRUS|nr:unnamed protein product [Darwinula stevensoni]CAG0903335.1 unnamed protein product [Darwinula stevensoni]
MTKSARAKKLSKKEKGKVQFKVGKPLPKGKNVTDLSFKAKKLVILQQHQDPNHLLPVTKKKQTLKNLLKLLVYHNAKARIEALQGMEELLRDSPWHVKSNSVEVIEQSAFLVNDRENKVRKQAVCFFEALLPLVEERALEPLFPILTAHLSCGMSHLEPNVRFDSLALFDVLLDHHPSLLVRNTSLALAFLNQISREKDSVSKSRSLHANPSTSTSGVQWYARVLHRLQRFLFHLWTLCKERSRAAAGSSEPIRTLRWEEGTPLFIILPEDFPVPILNLTKKGYQEKRSIFEDPIQCRNYMDVLTPLLIEIWTEILGLAIKIMDRLELPENHLPMLEWWKKLHGAPVERKLNEEIPYCVSEPRSKRKDSRSLAPRGLELDLNLAAAFLTSMLELPSASQTVSSIEGALEEGYRSKEVIEFILNLNGEWQKCLLPAALKRVIAGAECDDEEREALSKFLVARVLADPHLLG